MRVLIGLLICAVVALWAASAALAKGTIPKGYAYAAEVRVTLTYNARFTSDSGFEQDCTDFDGNTVKQSTGSHEVEQVNRTILFKHITVPVVPASKLGAAAARLALNPTITDPGRTTSDNSSYVLSGTLVADSNPCPQTISNYECTGAITDIGSIAAFMTLNGDGFSPTIFELPAGSPIEESDPEGCSAISWDNVAESIQGDAGRAYQQWEQVQLHSDLRPRLYALRDHSHVEFSLPVGPADPCPPLDFPMTSCSQTVTGTAHVKVNRLFLHRTKRSYPK